ncbi:sphingolipid delta(4)-desaturase DES1-like isoform X2 [Babylonia areolata]
MAGTTEGTSSDEKRRRVHGRFNKWFFSFVTLDFKMNDSEVDWQYAEEPHSSRRQEILRRHPEIKRLMGYDPNIACIVTAEVLLQVVLCCLVRDLSWPALLLLAYCVGAVLNHSLGSAIHEIGHNLAFGHGRGALNRALSVWCNLPIAVPMAVTYRKYHADHHRYLGEETNDVDVPTRLEAVLFRHPLSKVLWLAIHPILHGLRPFYKSPKPLTGWEAVNLACQAAFDGFVLVVFGLKPLAYLAAGTLFGFGLHPLAGHFISEHYLFHGGQATHSYYGPLNFVLFNVGYHNEHHDFPYVPYSRLPEVRRLAPEFYDSLPCHTSWVKVIWDFVFDKDMGPHAHGVGYPGESVMGNPGDKGKVQ